MNRELANLRVDEMWEWESARRAEIELAVADGRISAEVGDSLLSWVWDNVQEYLSALHQGLIRMER